jgi:membrane associated rhomboid family serine protease
MSLTIIIAIIISIVSILAFSNYDLLARLQFNAYQIYHRKEYYRLLTHGFVHADWMHLIINMLVFWSFGVNVEMWFSGLEADGYMRFADAWFLFLFFGGMAFASLTSLKKHYNNFGYNSVGASGGVAAVTFTAIFFAPYQKVYLYFIPIPGILFGVAYLGYSYYMSKRGSHDYINHDAHFMGAVFGFLFPLLINPKFFLIFINQLFFLK